MQAVCMCVSLCIASMNIRLVELGSYVDPTWRETEKLEFWRIGLHDVHFEVWSKPWLVSKSSKWILRNPSNFLGHFVVTKFMLKPPSTFAPHTFVASRLLDLRNTGNAQGGKLKVMVVVNTAESQSKRDLRAGLTRKSGYEEGIRMYEY